MFRIYIYINTFNKIKNVMYYSMFKSLQKSNYRNFYNCYLHLNVCMYIILIIKVLKIQILNDILVNFIIQDVSVLLIVLNNFTFLKIFDFLKFNLKYARKPFPTHHYWNDQLQRVSPVAYIIYYNLVYTCNIYIYI